LVFYSYERDCATLSGIGLALLGIPLHWHRRLWQEFTFIPNIGPAVELPQWRSLLDAPWKALAVLALYIGIQQVETNLLTPHGAAGVAAASCDALSQVFFATFFGFLGCYWLP